MFVSNFKGIAKQIESFKFGRPISPIYQLVLFFVDSSVLILLKAVKVTRMAILKKTLVISMCIIVQKVFWEKSFEEGLSIFIIGSKRSDDEYADKYAS